MKKLVICIVIFLIVPVLAFGQLDKIDLAHKKVTIKMEKRPLGEILKYLMGKYDILIGFERSNLDMGKPDYAFDTNLSDGEMKTAEFEAQDGLKVKIIADHVFTAPDHPITVIVENKPLKEVFDTIVRQMNNYDWEINGDVVNIFPKKGREQRFRELLDIRISSFKFKKGETIWQITKRIKELPEIEEFLNRSNLYFSGERFGLVSILESQYGKKIDVEMNFSNITFKELLNKITRIKRGGWIIKNQGFSRNVQRDYIDIDI